MYKTTNQIERENKTLKSQFEERTNEMKNLKSERRKDKNDFENKLKIKLNELEQQYVNPLQQLFSPSHLSLDQRNKNERNQNA